MLTEYAGHRLLALWHEARTLPLRANLYRLWYEFARRAGLHRRRYQAEPISDDALREALGGRFGGPDDLLAHLRSRQVPFFFDWRGREAYARILNDRFAEDRAECLRLADEVCAHRFEMMGCQVAFGDEIDWHRMLEQEASWPRRHWSGIDIRCPNAPGEIKTTWELNRHQFWLHLGRAYWYTGDERYPAEWARQLRSWIEQNPVEIGVNWLSNLEHAIRVVSWSWSLHFFLDSPALTADLVWEMYRVLLAKGRHIRTDVAYSCNVMRNNHVLGDALGLVFLGFVFPEFEEARPWREYGLDLLYGWLPDQVRPDGTSIESAVSYHRFVLYFYLLADLLHRANGGRPPPTVRERTERMVEVLQAVLKPDGSVSLYGDNDNAKTVFLSNEGPLDYRPTLATGAALFGRPDFKHTAGRLSQEVLWLLGPEGLDAWDRLDAAPPDRTLCAFPQGGLTTWRSGWDESADYLLLKGGPFTGHTEADLGHVDLSVGGEPVFVDAGTFTYNGDWPWRTFFRGTRAHNTVSVDGRGQALAHRSFRFLFHPDRTGSEVSEMDGVRMVKAWHRSFRYVKGGRLRHLRLVLVVRGAYWVVVDRLTGGRDEHGFAQHWHVAPSAAVEVGPGGRATVRTEGGAEVAMVPLDVPGLEVQTAEGETEPIQGWTTRGFGTKMPARCLTVAWRSRTPTLMATAIVPRGRGVGEDLRLEISGRDASREQGPDAGGFRLVSDGGEEFLEVTVAPHGTFVVERRGVGGEERPLRNPDG
ncbi:MAG: alginate lyase family protein [Phycisphaerae bacterium]